MIMRNQVVIPKRKKRKHKGNKHKLKNFCKKKKEQVVNEPKKENSGSCLKRIQYRKTRKPLKKVKIPRPFSSNSLKLDFSLRILDELQENDVSNTSTLQIIKEKQLVY